MGKGQGGSGTELDRMWEDYGLDQFEEGMSQLFPSYRIPLGELLEEVMSGDIFGAMAHFFQGIAEGVTGELSGMRNVLVWLLILGVAAALIAHFVEIFDKHQIADLSFYFMYLLLTAVLLQCFSRITETARTAIESILLFVKLLVPTYLIAVGVASGTATVSAGYQLMILLVYGVQNILLGVVMPLIYAFFLLSMIGGVWMEEKLALLIELLEKGIGWILKAALGIVTGVSIFQSLITSVIDSVKASSLQKAISAIPGVGNAADGVVELVVGSAVVIKNSIGIILLLLLLVLCAVPLLRIFLTAFLLKAAAALIGIVSDKRITAFVNQAGNAGMQLFRTTATAMLLFLITIAIVAASTNRGF